MNKSLEQREINGEELKALLELRADNEARFVLIDVREEYEYNISRIKGVDYLIPLSQFHDKIKKLEKYKDTPVIMQCKLGGRSQQAQRQLDEMGFKKVINLAGGIMDYPGEKKYGN